MLESEVVIPEEVQYVEYMRGTSGEQAYRFADGCAAAAAYDDTRRAILVNVDAMRNLSLRVGKTSRLASDAITLILLHELIHAYQHVGSGRQEWLVEEQLLRVLAEGHAVYHAVRIATEHGMCAELIDSVFCGRWRSTWIGSVRLRRMDLVEVMGRIAAREYMRLRWPKIADWSTLVKRQISYAEIIGSWQGRKECMPVSKVPDEDVRTADLLEKLARTCQGKSGPVLKLDYLDTVACLSPAIMNEPGLAISWRGSSVLSYRAAADETDVEIVLVAWCCEDKASTAWARAKEYHQTKLDLETADWPGVLVFRCEEYPYAGRVLTTAVAGRLVVLIVAGNTDAENQTARRIVRQLDERNTP